MSFTVYKSSAGSGKTFTLVKEYLKIALADKNIPPQQYRRILAITFTNKAATEMKNRVLKSLKDLSLPTTETVSAGTLILKKLLIQDLKIDGATLQQRAHNVLESILHHYSDFAISTIDSFIHKVIRTFAFDLKLPAGFEIEMDENHLLHQAIELLLSKIGSDKDLTRALIEFTESKADDEKSWRIENDLLEFSRNLLKENNIVYLDKIKKLEVKDFIGIRNQLHKHIRKFENQIQSLAQEAFSSIQKSMIPPPAFHYGEKGIYGYFKKMSEGKFDKFSNSFAEQTIQKDKWASAKAGKSELTAINALIPLLSTNYHKIQDLLKSDLSNYVLFIEIRKSIYPLAVINEIEKILIEYKQKNNILHISEFNSIISKIVLDNPVPFIYERLGEKYHHYLIDEFQDTSILQWQNLLPLIDNSLAEGHFNMIVGDGKQAIYRWRGGEVEQFSKLPEVHHSAPSVLVKEREASLKRNYVGKQLSSNFRSRKEIVEFNNSFFTTLSSRLDDSLKNIYTDHIQEFNEQNTGGYISVEFIDADKQQFEEINLNKIYETIIRIQDDGFRLKDIAILCRKNMQGSNIANFLTGKNIPVVSSDSLLLKRSAEINFMVAALTYLMDEQNEVAKVTMLSYLISKNAIKEKSIHHCIQLRDDQEFSFSQLLERNGISFSPSTLNKLPLYEAAEALTRLFALNKSISVQFFLEEINNYVIKNNNSLDGFLEWWNNEKYQPSLSVPENMDAVKIMSIHRSKGLEFPVTIIPFANWTIDYGNDNIWVNLENKDIPELKSAILPVSEKLTSTEFAGRYHEEKNKSLLDNINLLYVALTRAGNRMYILTGKSNTKEIEKFKTVTDIFNCFFDSSGLKCEGQQVYEYGNKMLHASSEAENSTATYLPECIHSQSWTEKIKIRTSPLTKDLSQIKDGRMRGNLYHEAFSKIRIREDVKPVINELYKKGDIDRDEIIKMEEKINKILSNEDIGLFFDRNNRVKIETEILLPNGKTYRPDRIIFGEKSTVIIDFKTGEKKDRYHQQLKEYAQVMKEMGYKSIDKYLLYIDKEQLEKV